MRQLIIQFNKCYTCPVHHSEQGFGGEWCYNERPYREIKESDGFPFPVWCKAKEVVKENN